LHKFFVNPNDISGQKISICDDAGHISRVLRLSAGDKVIVFDGTGTEYRCELEIVGKNECVAAICDTRACTSEASIKATLFQAIPKSGKMELIIQKCTELGIFEIYPFFSEYTVVKLDSERERMTKTERWQKIAVEAAKQCGRGVVPKIHSPIEFDAAIKIAQNLDSAIMPYELLAQSEKKDLRKLLSNIEKQKNIGIIIGSEGGFCESEAEIAESAGIKLVGLGKRILRTETAGLAVLSIIMYENGEI